MNDDEDSKRGIFNRTFKIACTTTKERKNNAVK